MEDTRPPQYHYWDQLLEHIGSGKASPREFRYNNKIFFDGSLLYPRQLEIHLPGNHIIPCDLHCPHCAGKKFDKPLGTWEMDGLSLLDKLKGKVPYHIYGGAYTEPTLNPYFMSYLAMTKRHGNHFGIHTHGVYLELLEEMQGFLTELNRISTDETDYLSISLDAGTPESWTKTKGYKGNGNGFYEILNGVEHAVAIRKKAKKGHAIRLCYLVSPYSGSDDDFNSIINLAQSLQVDSLRFSIPFAPYNQDFNKVREYKMQREVPANLIMQYRLEPYLSKSQDEKPYIFYTGSEFTDIDKFTFHKCLYGYYQLTLGADGYYYKCSTTATPTMEMCRLGKVSDNLADFHQIIKFNQNFSWDAHTCFDKGARCNRMGLEINTEYAKLQPDVE